MIEIPIKLIEEKLMANFSYETKETIGLNGIRSLSLSLIEQCPKELEKNVYEWLFDLPISEIKYQGLSYNDFLILLKNNNCLSKTNDKNFYSSFISYLTYIQNNKDIQYLEQRYGKKFSE